MEVIINEPTWELCKENVAPLKRGRKAEKINRVFGKETSIEEDVQIRAKFEEDVTNGQVADPLAVWIKYTAWLEDRYPLDRSQAFLVRERCLRSLKDETRYQNDSRYVKVWIDYIDCLEAPLEALKYMQIKGIGLDVSDFWLSWARIAEDLGRRRLATQIYAKAIETLAEPDPLLLKRRDQLTEAPPQPARSRPRSNRQVLANSQLSRRSRRQQSPSFVSSAPSNNDQSQQNLSFALFVDENLRDIDELAEASDDDWPDFATSASRGKENSLPPAPWTISKIGYLPPRPALRGASPAVEIFIDDDTTTSSPAASPVTVAPTPTNHC
uniref:BUB1 N-terminal domain-containing protein n=1 Tax=Aureoumbra lagunensis TaxID=44058 RepID=A0A7S3NIM8_9STRA